MTTSRKIEIKQKQNWFVTDILNIILWPKNMVLTFFKVPSPLCRKSPYDLFQFFTAFATVSEPHVNCMTKGKLGDQNLHFLLDFDVSSHVSVVQAFFQRFLFGPTQLLGHDIQNKTIWAGPLFSRLKNQ